MKEHTHIYPYIGTICSTLGYYYYDTLFQFLYIKVESFYT